MSSSGGRGRVPVVDRRYPERGLYARLGFVLDDAKLDETAAWLPRAGFRASIWCSLVTGTLPAGLCEVPPRK